MKSKNTLKSAEKSSIEVKIPENIKEWIDKILEETWWDISDFLNDVLKSWFDTISSWTKIKQFLDWKIDKIDISLKSFVLENLEKADYLTKWTEWEVFLMDIPWVWESVVLKKRYDNSKQEASNHRVINDLEKEFNKINPENIVKTPKLFDSFDDWKNEFLVMEFIKWKTLYTKIIEKMSKDLFFKNYKKISSDYKKKEFIYEFCKHIYKGDEFLDFRSFSKLEIKIVEKFLLDDNDNFKDIDLWNDTGSESFFLEISDILFESWVISEKPNLQVKDPITWIIKNPYFEKAYSDSIESGIWVFTKKQWSEIHLWLKDFLNFIHKKWFYHRDIWHNPRNIMLVEDLDSDWEVFFTPYVLDFWKSSQNSSESTYQDNLSWWFYDKDDLVLKYFSELISEKEDDLGFLDLKWNNEKILELWEKFWFKASFLESKISILKSNAKKMWFKNFNDKNFLNWLVLDFLRSNDLTTSEKNNYWNCVFFSFKNDSEFRKNATLNSKSDIFLALSFFEKDDLISVKNIISDFEFKNMKNNVKKIKNICFEYIDEFLKI